MKRHSTAKPDFYRTESTVNKSKILKPQTPDRRKSKERESSEKIMHSNQHFLKGSYANKQQNVSPDITSSLNTVQYNPLDDSAFVEVMVKTANPPKQRSRSTVCDRKPWGNLLNKHTSVDEESIFGKFDPLRTLHFLARELQTHMQARLPEEPNVQEIIKAMHSALKRIPPEVASTVQLQQQTIDLLPKLRKTGSKDSFDEKLADLKSNQPPTNLQSKEFGEIQKLIEGSTMKLEARCKHLESLLQNESSNSKLLETRINEMELANKQLTYNLNEKDVESVRLKSTIDILESKLKERKSTNGDVQSIVGELKKSKLHLEQENLKLQHQLRLCAIEKEKYLAILAVRDRQIYEIRSEMTQLQQSVNEQLVQLHNCATASIPGGRVMLEYKGNKEVETISSIWADEDDKLQPTRDIFQGIS